MEFSRHRLTNKGDIVGFGRTGQKCTDHQVLGSGDNLLSKSKAEHVDEQPQLPSRSSPYSLLGKKLHRVARWNREPKAFAGHRMLAGGNPGHLGRMIIVESFACGAVPRGPPSSDAAIRL